MVQLCRSIFLLATMILAFGAMDSFAAPPCRSCLSAGEVRGVAADRNASNITVSHEDTIGYVLAFSLVHDLL
jgi:hypothetical protein